jgi:hypothetical protein
MQPVQTEALLQVLQYDIAVEHYWQVVERYWVDEQEQSVGDFKVNVLLQRAQLVLLVHDWQLAMAEEHS